MKPKPMYAVQCVVTTEEPLPQGYSILGMAEAIQGALPEGSKVQRLEVKSVVRPDVKADALQRQVGEMRGALDYLVRVYAHVSRDDMSLGQAKGWDRARAALSGGEATAEPRDTRAEVWAEGYASGFSNAMRRMSDEPNAPTTSNPYAAPGGTSNGTGRATD